MHLRQIYLPKMCRRNHNRGKGMFNGRRANSRGKGFGSRPCRMSIKYAALGTARPRIGLVNQRLKFRHPQSLTSSRVAGASKTSAIALLALTTDQFQ